MMTNPPAQRKGRHKLVAAATVIAVVVLVSVALLLQFPNNQPATEQATSTGSSANGPPWQVLKTNTTVYYGTACMVIAVIAGGCPTENNATHSPSVNDAELIS